jgi:methyl-accepting chemotaxis protein
MKFFYNIKISAKLLISFITVALIAGLIGLYGIVSLRNVNENDTKLYEENVIGIENTATIIKSFLNLRIVGRDLILNYESAERKQYADNTKQCVDDLMAAAIAYDNSITSQEDRSNFTEVKGIIDQYIAAITNIINEAEAGESTAVVYDEYKKSGDTAIAIQQKMDAIYQWNIQQAHNRSDNNTATANQATIIMIAIVILAVVLSIIFGVFISNIISPQVSLMSKIANMLVVGDINIEKLLKEKDYNIKLRKDEIGELALAFNKLIESTKEQAQAAQSIAEGDMTVDVAIRSENDLLGIKLHELVVKNNEVLNDIASAAEQVSTGAKQISDSSIVLSQGATEQASSIEELTASMEEISAQTKQNAEHATQANELAETAKINAVQGNDQMREMLKAMHDINESSANISKIIKVIDDIAFQTNILALNAAVEAARAGQHGKGFAVVAEEVRNLAARSANAAKETTDMIEGSIKKVEGGTKMANETANALTTIVDDISKVARLVNEIASASNEQALGISQINQGIMQVSQVVQTNSATSEEGAAASEELSSQAEVLRNQVKRFKLKKAVRVSSYQGLDEINPDVLKLLESMRSNSNSGSSLQPKYHSEAASNTVKIALSDKEFGKY